MRNYLVKIALILALSSVAAASIAQPSNGRGERRGPPPFTELDLDGDGVLTLAEFQEHQLPRGDHETLFSHIDADSDGGILESEWSSHKPPGRGQGRPE